MSEPENMVPFPNDLRESLVSWVRKTVDSGEANINALKVWLEAYDEWQFNLDKNVEKYFAELNKAQAYSDKWGSPTYYGNNWQTVPAGMPPSPHVHSINQSPPPIVQPRPPVGTGYALGLRNAQPLLSKRVAWKMLEPYAYGIVGEQEFMGLVPLTSYNYPNLQIARDEESARTYIASRLLDSISNVKGGISPDERKSWNDFLYVFVVKGI